MSIIKYIKYKILYRSIVYLIDGSCHFKRLLLSIYVIFRSNKVRPPLSLVSQIKENS